MHSALAAGAASLVIPSAGFDAARTLKSTKDGDVTSAFMVPQQWHLLCDEIERTGETGLSLTHASWGGAPATAEAFAGGCFHSGDLVRRDAEGFLYDRLARYDHPTDVTVLDALPRTGMGKIHKTALRGAV